MSQEARSHLRVASKPLERVQTACYVPDPEEADDVGDLLEKLNDLRKDVQYGEPGPDLQALDLEELAADLELFIDEVERLVQGDRG